MSQTTVARDDRGFTVLELLIVIAIASMLSTVAALRLPELSNRTAMDRLGGEIEREILSAGRRARESGTDQVIRFDTAFRRLELPDGRGIAFDEATAASWLGAAEGIDRADGMLTLFGSGGASGGELLLRRGNQELKIRIDWLSARPSRTRTQPQ